MTWELTLNLNREIKLRPWKYALDWEIVGFEREAFGAVSSTCSSPSRECTTVC